MAFASTSRDLAGPHDQETSADCTSHSSECTSMRLRGHVMMTVMMMMRRKMCLDILQSNFCRSGLVPYSSTWASEWTVCSSSSEAFRPRMHWWHRREDGRQRKKDETRVARRLNATVLSKRQDSRTKQGIVITGQWLHAARMSCLFLECMYFASVVPDKLWKHS